MSVLVVPVESTFESYTFQIDLDAALYTLTFNYNSRMDRWIMGVRDGQDNVLLAGVPVQIEWDLLLQYVGISTLPPGRFMSLDESGQRRDPTRDLLGNEVKLFYDEAA